MASLCGFKAVSQGLAHEAIAQILTFRIGQIKSNQKQQNLLKLEKDLQSLLSNKPIEELILINLNKEDFIEKFLEPVKKANLNIVNITSQTLGKFLLNYIIRE